MILIIDLNPSMNKTYMVDKICIGNEIRSKSSFYKPGGDGIAIAKLLNIFNESGLITGFLGGVNGETYHRKLMENGIIHKVVPIKDETRTNIEILDEDKNRTIISENGPRITREEIVSLYELYNELIEESNLIIYSGFLPKGVSSDIYFDLVNISNRKERISILDAKNEAGLRAIDASPYIVVISKKEFEELIGLKLESENEIIRASQVIFDKGVKILIINLYNKGIIVLEDGKGHRLDTTKLDIKMNNSSDNLGVIAGFALGISRNYDFEMTLKLSQAFSIGYLMEPDINQLEMSEIKRLMGEIEIYNINY